VRERRERGGTMVLSQMLFWELSYIVELCFFLEKEERLLCEKKDQAGEGAVIYPLHLQ
jgi:hypothetical protein